MRTRNETTVATPDHGATPGNPGQNDTLVVTLFLSDHDHRLQFPGKNTLLQNPGGWPRSVGLAMRNAQSERQESESCGASLERRRGAGTIPEHREPATILGDVHDALRVGVA